MKIRKSFYLYISLFFLSSQFGCSTKLSEKQNVETGVDEDVVTLTDAQLKNAEIEEMEISDQQISVMLKMNGKIDVPPQNLISISAPLGGYLKKTDLVAGMKVSKGQVLAVLENPQFIQLQQDYLTAKSKYNFANLDYIRQRDLNQAQASSDKVMQAAQSEMNNQQILMNTIAQQLRMVHINPDQISSSNIINSVAIYSPISGYVSKVNVNIGKYLSPTDVLFELINPSNIHLNIKVLEKDLEKLKIGQDLEAYSNLDPKTKYPARIQLKGSVLDENGLADVQCQFINSNMNLVPGTYMNVDIASQTAFSKALPEESIVDFKGQNYVFVNESKNTYRMVPITIGESDRGFVKVLNDQDFQKKKVVSKNAYTLLMKLKNTEEE